MASRQDLDYSYSTIDRIFRLSIGENGDFSGARYNGDFSLTLEEAQRAKHEFMADSLRITKESKVLDMGCGWGPFLNFLREKGAKGIGLTLSQGQLEACRKNGLEVYLKDCKKVCPEDYGQFDAVVSVGAFEHFCSIEEWQKGNQHKIYNDFFHTVYQLLPRGARLYLQTMTFGENMIEFKDMDINAPKGSPPHLLALMVKQFPGSWLPYGQEIITKNASPYFKLISSSSGRLDYIETISQWRIRFRKFQLRKYLLYLSLLPKILTDKEFRHRVDVFRISPNKLCFEKKIMDHYRMVFEKI